MSTGNTLQATGKEIAAGSNTTTARTMIETAIIGKNGITTVTGESSRLNRLTAALGALYMSARSSRNQ